MLSTLHIFRAESNSYYLERLGGEGCDQLYTLARPVGMVEELLSLDSDFGRFDLLFKDVEIFSDEENPVDFGPSTSSFRNYSWRLYIQRRLPCS